MNAHRRGDGKTRPQARATFLMMFAALYFCSSPGLCARGTVELADSLAGITDYNAHVSFEILPVSAADPVVYNIDLQSDAVPMDTLSPCSYLVSWSMEGLSGPREGFTAYFDGNFYRHRRGSMMQEYHYTSNPGAFAPSGNVDAGVQMTSQFTDLLPQFIGRHLREIAVDTAYVWQWHPDTVIGGRRCMAVDGVKRANGYDARYFSYAFDPATSVPVHVKITTSPGTMSEQEMTVTYYPANHPTIELSEEGLAEWRPEVFANFRESTFRAENLTGHQMPAYSARLSDGSGRYNYQPDESSGTPLLLVVLDPQVSTCAETVRDVRRGVDLSPRSAHVIWAIDTADGDVADDVTGGLRQDETSVISIADLKRRCGITLYPTIMAVDGRGVVRAVQPGYNQDIDEFVVQTIALMR